MAPTVEQTARALYEQAQKAAAQWAKMGTAPRGIQAATLEEITAHVAACAELSAQYRMTMDPAALWGEDLQARARAKARTNAGRRGVKALKAKYGDDVAARIVYEHSGRGIR